MYTGWRRGMEKERGKEMMGRGMQGGEKGFVVSYCY